MTTPDARAAAPAPTLRAESEALLAAYIAGASGAVVGLVLGLLADTTSLWGTWGLGSWAALAGAIAAGISSALGFWRSRSTDSDDWRRDIADWRYVVSTASVVIAHVALTAIGVLALFALLARAFIGVQVNGFWTTALMALVVGLAAYLAYLSSSRMTTQRLTSPSSGSARSPP
jgi:peptidoglycan biosynthesis protein MviN/MurJ (putative lipid II flippase)